MLVSGAGGGMGEGGAPTTIFLEVGMAEGTSSHHQLFCSPELTVCTLNLQTPDVDKCSYTPLELFFGFQSFPDLPAARVSRNEKDDWHSALRVACDVHSIPDHVWHGQ